MVRPVNSKRKLFNASKEQKENDPAGEVRAKAGENYSDTFSLGGQRRVAGISVLGLGAGKVVDNGWGVGEDVATSTHHTTTTPSRPVMPMSERQQIALLMQMSSPSPPDKLERSSSPRTPGTPSLSGRGVNKRNERGETPLHVAAIKGDTERIAQLIDQGADVNATDYAGWSALHEACNRGFYGVSKQLIQAGADVNAKGLDNDTPLHDACINNHFKLVRLLLRCGAGVDVVNRRGKTPRDVCRSPGIAALIEAAATGQLSELGGNSSDELTPIKRKGCVVVAMSRRTPPAKTSGDEKPGGGGGGGGPGSPRVTLRLPNTRAPTPEKPRPHETKSSGVESSEDVYEFKCSKDEGRGEEDEEKGGVGGGGGGGGPGGGGGGRTETSGGNGSGGQTEDKTDKRVREDQEEDEEARKRRKKEDAKENNSKGVGRGGSRPTGASDKTLKAGGRGGTSSGTGPSTLAKQSGGTTGAAGEQRKSPMGSAANSPKPPTTSDNEEDNKAGECSGGAAPKVPPLKIMLGGGAAEQEPSGNRNGKTTTSRLPYVVNTSDDQPTDAKDMGVKVEDSGAGSNGSSGGEKGSGTRITRSRGGGTTGAGGNASAAEESTTDEEDPPDEMSTMRLKTEVKVEESHVTPTSPPDAVHPRKRKIRMKESEPEPAMVSLVDQPISNCYETFLKIRKQIERRRENLRPVQPKPPQGFKDYLMNRCSYVLAGNASSRLSVPVITPPASLSQLLKDLFNEQEKERYRLRLQHLIEKEKLVLSVEQEILRVHGRAARALANQALPFSVCTFLKDEEVYNIISPEQEKDGNARSRYNGRLFLSWLQDVDDKWDKIKENMVLRHHNEAESLHAVQKMEWEWKLREVGECDNKSRPQIDDLHVPMVHVSDDFDLLPA